MLPQDQLLAPTQRRSSSDLSAAARNPAATEIAVRIHLRRNDECLAAQAHCLRLPATEGHSWRLTVDGARSTRIPAPDTTPVAAADEGPNAAGVSVRGTASELVLFVCDRIPADSLQIDGDAGLFDLSAPGSRRCRTGRRATARIEGKPPVNGLNSGPLKAISGQDAGCLGPDRPTGPGQRAGTRFRVGVDALAVLACSTAQRTLPCRDLRVTSRRATVNSGPFHGPTAVLVEVGAPGEAFSQGARRGRPLGPDCGRRRPVSPRAAWRERRRHAPARKAGRLPARWSLEWAVGRPRQAGRSTTGEHPRLRCRRQARDRLPGRTPPRGILIRAQRRPRGRT